MTRGRLRSDDTPPRRLSGDAFEGASKLARLSIARSEEPEPPRRAEPDAALVAVDGELEPRPLQPAKAEHRQAWSIGGSCWVDHDALIQLQAERPIIPHLIALPRLVPVQPDIGVMERNSDIVDADIADLSEILRLQAGPLNEVFPSDTEVVREARIQDGGKARRTGHEFALLDFRQAHPDHDLLRLDRHLSIPNHDDRPCVEVGKVP